MVYFFEALACIVCGLVLVGVGIYCAVPALAAVGGVITCCGIAYTCAQVLKERKEYEQRALVAEAEERKLRKENEKKRADYQAKAQVAEKENRELMAESEKLREDLNQSEQTLKKERKDYQAQVQVAEKENRKLMAENDELREDLNQSDQTLKKERKESKKRIWAAEEKEYELRAKNEELQDKVNSLLEEKGEFLEDYGPVIALMERAKADQAREQQREANARSSEQQMHGTTNLQIMTT